MNMTSPTRAPVEPAALSTARDSATLERLGRHKHVFGRLPRKAGRHLFRLGKLGVAPGHPCGPSSLHRGHVRLKLGETRASDGVEICQQRERKQRHRPAHKERVFDGRHRGARLIGGTLLGVETGPRKRGEHQSDDHLGEVLAHPVARPEHALPPQPVMLHPVLVNEPAHQHVKNHIIWRLGDAPDNGGTGDKQRRVQPLHLEQCEERGHEAGFDEAEHQKDRGRVDALEKPEEEGQRRQPGRDDGGDQHEEQVAELIRPQADDVD
mmetsp:Transcript_7306/g.23975  ORF Transcript_7306/g.23975 Transcript_7306/m.23975 type:complete len:266 (+) Transcript_7306:209-1006(+)